MSGVHYEHVYIGSEKVHNSFEKGEKKARRTGLDGDRVEPNLFLVSFHFSFQGLGWIVFSTRFGFWLEFIGLTLLRLAFALKHLLQCRFSVHFHTFL